MSFCSDIVSSVELKNWVHFHKIFAGCVRWTKESENFYSFETLNFLLLLLLRTFFSPSSSSCWLTKYLLSLINSDRQNDHCVLQKIFDCKMAKLTDVVKHFHDIIFDSSA